jgi:hypothetical protein
VPNLGENQHQKGEYMEQRKVVEEQMDKAIAELINAVDTRDISSRGFYMGVISGITTLALSAEIITLDEFQRYDNRMMEILAKER